MKPDQEGMDELRILLTELQARYEVSDAFVGRIFQGVFPLGGLVSGEARQALGGLLEEMFEIEKGHTQIAKKRVQALVSLRESLQEHLEMLEELRATVEKSRARSPQSSRRRFSIDDLPPN